MKEKIDRYLVIFFHVGASFAVFEEEEKGKGKEEGKGRRRRRRRGGWRVRE